MASESLLRERKVTDEEGRQRALAVLADVYRHEKQWVEAPEQIFPTAHLGNESISWFLAEIADRPVGVIRVSKEIPFSVFEKYRFELVDPQLDVEAFLRQNRVAEVGCFAVRPRYRGRIRVVASLMRAAVTEAVERDLTHFVTDVYEGESSSPLRFHERVLGFRIWATHEAGELRFEGRRITLVLDIRDFCLRLIEDKKWISRFITKGWGDQLIEKLTADKEQRAE